MFNDKDAYLNLKQPYLDFQKNEKLVFGTLIFCNLAQFIS